MTVCDCVWVCHGCVQAAEHLQSFIADCDRRTELAKKRLAETQEEISAEVAAKVTTFRWSTFTLKCVSRVKTDADVRLGTFSLMLDYCCSPSHFFHFLSPPSVFYYLSPFLLFWDVSADCVCVCVLGRACA